jgi:hypothetical protein
VDGKPNLPQLALRGQFLSLNVSKVFFYRGVGVSYVISYVIGFSLFLEGCGG